MAFTTQEKSACRKLIDLALKEDLGDVGDVTSQAIIPTELSGQAAIVVRADGRVAGLPTAELVCKAVDKELAFKSQVIDGAVVKNGERIATISGRMRSLLAVERTVLNFLQHLSGIATLTAKYVAAIEGLRARILDTRKTTPGWRLLEKYAVRCGGGSNHRIGLYDGILIKDNHLAASTNKLDIDNAVEKALGATGTTLPVEVEVETLEQLKKVLLASPTIVLLDNMTPDRLRDAVQIRDQTAPKVLLEASGGITLENVRAIAETGVDRISVGALTHSAPALDIALDYLSP